MLFISLIFRCNNNLSFVQLRFGSCERICWGGSNNRILYQNRDPLPPHRWGGNTFGSCLCRQLVALLRAPTSLLALLSARRGTRRGVTHRFQGVHQAGMATAYHALEGVGRRPDLLLLK